MNTNQHGRTEHHDASALTKFIDNTTEYRSQHQSAQSRQSGNGSGNVFVDTIFTDHQLRSKLLEREDTRIEQHAKQGNEPEPRTGKDTRHILHRELFFVIISLRIVLNLLVELLVHHREDEVSHHTTQQK